LYLTNSDMEALLLGLLCSYIPGHLERPTLFGES
jgi:hypothetical protein